MSKPFGGTPGPAVHDRPRFAGRRRPCATYHPDSSRAPGPGDGQIIEGLYALLYLYWREQARRLTVNGCTPPRLPRSVEQPRRHGRRRRRPGKTVCEKPCRCGMDMDSQTRSIASGVSILPMRRRAILALHPRAGRLGETRATTFRGVFGWIARAVVHGASKRVSGGDAQPTKSTRQSPLRRAGVLACLSEAGRPTKCSRTRRDTGRMPVPREAGFSYTREGQRRQEPHVTTGIPAR